MLITSHELANNLLQEKRSTSGDGERPKTGRSMANSGLKFFLAKSVLGWSLPRIQDDEGEGKKIRKGKNEKKKKERRDVGE